jgi:hypothetical protein
MSPQPDPNRLPDEGQSDDEEEQKREADVASNRAL